MTGTVHLPRGVSQRDSRPRSQTVTLERGAKVKHAPYAFTERGAIMAANILNHALPTTQRRRCLARVETPQPTRRHPWPDGRLAPVHRQEKVGRRLRSALFTQKRNRPEPARGHLNLQSAAAQPSKFLTTDGHEWARINPDQAGKPASPKVRPYHESNASSHRFGIRVHSGPFAVQRPF